MIDRLNRLLIDYHTLDRCDCGDILIHTKRFCYPEDPEWVIARNLRVASWECPECGVVDIRYETEDGRGLTYDELKREGDV